MWVSRRLTAGIPRLPEAAGAGWGELPGAGPVLRVVMIGDSVAAGVGAATQEEALPGQVAAGLAGLTGRPVSWRVVARRGATARRVRQAQLGQLTDPTRRWQPDLVLVVVGANDAIRLRRPAAFRRDVAALVASIRHRLGRDVPVMLLGLPPVHRFPALPPWGRWPLGAYARRLDAQLRRVAARETDVSHLPVGALPISPAVGLASDRFHPSPAGHRAWGRSVAASVATVLDAG
ncbi:SGNH/GDSL hydrolase family protein [Streptomyces hainanensis]|uniref:SGNH/GDSL hydrolase family protein n=1 Tax=Streptomyces hainanensis TaxID=402648 RepID=A0A4R4SEJ2_9ACTN|nr:SGNH/GDSL hydrolase family protein [Streptomyces hainanensis]TDC61710.1 SGNH/GDSL hydrolase family protein [Streptomyces hainanensis]